MWLAEVRAGVYVGVFTRKTRERIWSDVVALIADGSAVMAWSATTDSGYDFVSVGTNRRMPADFDGLTLVSFARDADPTSEPEMGPRDR